MVHFCKMINEQTKLQSMENEKFFPPKKRGNDYLSQGFFQNVFLLSWT